MRPQQIIQSTSVKAAVALSNAHRFIDKDGNQCALGEHALGVLQATAAQDEYAPVATHGTVLVETGGAITADSFVKSDSVGRAVAAQTLTVTNLTTTDHLITSLFTPDTMLTMSVPGGAHSFPSPPTGINGWATESASGSGEFIQVFLL